MEQDGFYDRNHRYSDLVACENARIAEDLQILRSVRRHLDRFSRDDPHQKHAYALWSALLDKAKQLANLGCRHVDRYPATSLRLEVV